MKKAVGSIEILFKEILFAGFSIRIVFGLVWMCLHFVRIQDFGVPDGFLYPALLRLFHGAPRLLLLLQLALACYAGNELLRPICRPGFLWRVWYVLALLTFPMAMQCHMALLPYSFVSSLLFLETAYLRKALNGSQEPDIKELVKGAVCWLALALLLPEYGWLGGILPGLVVLLCLPGLRKKFRRLAYCVLIIAAFGGMIAGVHLLNRSEENAGGSFWFSLACRTTWPTIWNDAALWPAELRAVTDPVLAEVSRRPGNMERLLRPAMEEGFGEEQAARYYRLMARQAWRDRKPMIVRQAGWDALVYVLPQVMLPVQLTGEGYDSFSGRNYEIMWKDSPLLTKYYIRYSGRWFVVSLAVTALLTIAGAVSGEIRISRKTLAFLAVCAVWAGSIVFYYILRGAGISDYKCTAAVSAMWTVWALFCMSPRDCR